MVFSKLLSDSRPVPDFLTMKKGEEMGPNVSTDRWLTIVLIVCVLFLWWLFSAWGLG